MLEGHIGHPFAQHLRSDLVRAQVCVLGPAEKARAALALHRFGMGPRPGSIAAIQADPLGALLAELDRGHAGEVSAPSLPSSAQAFRTVADANAERQARRIVAARAQKEERAAAGSSMAGGNEQADNEMAAKVAAEAVPD